MQARNTKTKRYVASDEYGKVIGLIKSDTEVCVCVWGGGGGREKGRDRLIERVSEMYRTMPTELVKQTKR